MTHRHEMSDMDPKYVAYFAAGLVVAAIVIAAVTWYLLLVFESRLAGNALKPTLVEVPAVAPPEPRLQIAPSKDYQAQRKEELDALNSYGWVDRERGIAHIPIERAMEILAERGVK